MSCGICRAKLPQLWTAEHVPWALNPQSLHWSQTVQCGFCVRALAPEVTLDPAILHQLQEGQTVRSPGMKYQHYSPRAHVILVEGSWQNFAALAEQNRADGVYALVFDGEETMLSLPCLTYGRSGREQAQQIFSKLRELDDDGAQKVYVRAPKPEGIGLAVYNRLIRAAGFEVIQV